MTSCLFSRIQRPSQKEFNKKKKKKKKKKDPFLEGRQISFNTVVSPKSVSIPLYTVDSNYLKKHIT